jgi:hypothetical protein
MKALIPHVGAGIGDTRRTTLVLSLSLSLRRRWKKTQDFWPATNVATGAQTPYFVYFSWLVPAATSTITIDQAFIPSWAHAGTLPTFSVRDPLAQDAHQHAHDPLGRAARTTRSNAKDGQQLTNFLTAN